MSERPLAVVVPKRKIAVGISSESGVSGCLQ